MLTPTEHQAFADLAVLHRFHTLPLPEPRTPLAISMQTLSAELDARMHDNPSGSRRVRPDQLGMLFDTMMLAQAVITLDQNRDTAPEQMTPQRLREMLAHLIVAPSSVAEEVVTAIKRYGRRRPDAAQNGQPDPEPPATKPSAKPAPAESRIARLLNGNSDTPT